MPLEPLVFLLPVSATLRYSSERSRSFAFSPALMGCSPLPFYIFGCDSPSTSKHSFQWFLTPCLCFILSPTLHIRHTSHVVWHSVSDVSSICNLKVLSLFGFFLLPHLQWVFPFVLRHLPCGILSLSFPSLLSLPSPPWGFPLFPCEPNNALHFFVSFILSMTKLLGGRSSFRGSSILP